MIVAVLAARAEPTRLGAIRILWDGSEHCVRAPTRRPGATQCRMSRRMLVLKEAGLVADRSDGQRVRCRLCLDLPPRIGAPLSAKLAGKTLA